MVQLIFSKAENSLWYDQDKRIYDPKGWGICLKLYAGKMIRPVPKFWIKNSNPWQGDEPWFVIRVPFMLGPFLSIALGKYGFYIGFKRFTAKESYKPRYGVWMRDDEFGPDDNPAEYIQLTATIRRTRWV